MVMKKKLGEILWNWFIRTEIFDLTLSLPSSISQGFPPPPPKILDSIKELRGKFFDSKITDFLRFKFKILKNFYFIWKIGGKLWQSGIKGNEPYVRDSANTRKIYLWPSGQATNPNICNHIFLRTKVRFPSDMAIWQKYAHCLQYCYCLK